MQTSGLGVRKVTTITENGLEEVGVDFTLLIVVSSCSALIRMYPRTYLGEFHEKVNDRVFIFQ